MKDFENSSSSAGENEKSSMLYSRTSGSGSQDKHDNDGNTQIPDPITL